MVKLQNYGFYLTAIIGLGLAPVIPITTAFGQLDGSQFLDQRNDSRSFVLNGRWQASTVRQQDRQMAQLAADLNRDYIATRQPMTLLFEPMENGKPLRAPLAVPGVSYIGGLEGAVDGLPTADTPISFTQYLPIVAGGEDGVSLTTMGTISFQYIAQRSAGGQWAAMSTGMSGNGVYVLQYGLDGTLYAGGAFTDAGGSGADYIAQWNGSSWSVLSSATALNNFTYWQGLAVSSTGLLYVGGAFTNANGIANADAIATWNGSAWAALSTGANAPVYTIAIAPDGTVYAGGEFTTIGGVALGHIAQWNGSAWSAVGSGVGTAGGGVPYPRDIAIAQNGDVYIGGAFSSVDGVSATNLAKWDGTAWTNIGDATGSVSVLAIGPDQRLYAGGAVTSIEGVTINGIGVYNGVSWLPLGAGMPGGSVNTIVFDRKGGLYATGVYEVAGTIDAPGMAYWNGSSWVNLDIESPFPGVAIPWALALGGDGSLTIGNDTNANPLSVAALTTITNTSSMIAYPKLVITNTTASNVVLYNMRNINSDKAIYFDLTLLPSEIVTLILDPTRISMVSNTRGNLLSTILPGSDVSSFALQPGSNTISFFAASASVTAIMSWPVTFDTLTDGWTK